MKKKWERVCALFLATVLFCSLLTSCGPKKVSSLRLEGIEQETDLHQLQTVTLAVEPAGADLDKIQLVSTDETVLTITRGDSHESGKDAAQLSCVIESKMDGEASVYAQTEDGSVKSEEILIQVVDREKLAQTQQNAQAVESAIRAIGEVTLDRADAIAQARSLYDNSPADVLVLVGNYSRSGTNAHYKTGRRARASCRRGGKKNCSGKRSRCTKSGAGAKAKRPKTG